MAHLLRPLVFWTPLAGCFAGILWLGSGSVSAGAAPGNDPALPSLLGIAGELRELELSAPRLPDRTRGEGDRMGRHRDAPPPSGFHVLTSFSARIAFGPRDGFRPDRATSRVTRSSERIFFESTGGERSVAFLRNPVHRDRADATIVDFGVQRLLDLDAGELFDLGFGRTWTEISLLGLVPAELASLTPRGESVEAFGLTFERHVAADEECNLREVWWNAKNGVPLRAVLRRDGREWVRELVELELHADSELLGDLTDRFPGWERLDLSDWREEHEQTPGGHGGHRH